FECTRTERRVERENDGGIPIAHVPLSALLWIGASRFSQLITRRNDSLLRPAASWTPASMWNAIADGKIESRAIGARLPAGNDFVNHFHHHYAGIWPSSCKR